MLVWNPETLFRLRDAVGPKIGMNLDPSHLMWMGADPIASARALRGAQSITATARTPESSTACSPT